MCLSRQQLEGEHAEFLKTHVTGVLSHGHNLAWAFIDLLRWPADANPTINILLTVLRDIVHQVCKKNVFEVWIVFLRGKHTGID